MFTFRRFLVFLPLVAWSQAQETAPFELTDEFLVEQATRILPEIRKEFGEGTLKTPVTARIGTQREVREALISENRELLGRVFGEEGGEDQVRSFARSMARALFAKYAFATREILFLPNNLQRIAELLEAPEVNGPDCVFAILVHEMVHAADHDTWLDPDVLFATFSTQEQVTAYNAVLEGHAQHIARRICARLGKTEAFESFTRLIGTLPPPEDEDDPAAELMMRVSVAAMASAYYDGERFMATLEKEGGKKAVERAFRHPPQDVMEIFEPQWFLKPESKPERLFDLGNALAFLEARFPEETWRRQRLSVTPAQILASISGFVEAEQAEGLKRALRRVELLMVADKDDANRVMTFALVECKSPTDAMTFHSVNSKVLKVKDERFKKGPIQILESSYEESVKDGQPFLAGRKIMENRGDRGEVFTLLSTRKALAVEFSYINVEVDTNDAIALVREAIDAATKRGE
ncbi:MAG: hypothetical protein H6833_12760 [Planctomycetes bacterium]|nr:hypothetical protein [Planctomycetota bacterium]